MQIDWSKYSSASTFDELVGPECRARAGGDALMRHVSELGGEELEPVSPLP